MLACLPKEVVTCFAPSSAKAFLTLLLTSVCILQWEPLVLAIGLCESYRVACGWASPTGEGFNSLKDDYEMGNLG